VHRTGLPSAQFLDEPDALLQLRALLLELLHLLDDRTQPRGLFLSGPDLAVEAGRRLSERPVAPAHEKGASDQDQTAGHHQFLAGLEGDAHLDGALPLDGEEVDADHRSPVRRSARPTATAVVGMTASMSPTPTFAASSVT
jgi:hypothetical protein